MLLYIYFADRTACVIARHIIPSITSIPYMQARLILSNVIRFSLIPVGVAYCRYSLTACLCWLHSPDEGGLAAWIYALSRSPYSMIAWCRKARCTWKYSTLNECRAKEFLLPHNLQLEKSTHRVGVQPPPGRHLQLLLYIYTLYSHLNSTQIGTHALRWCGENNAPNRWRDL